MFTYRKVAINLQLWRLFFFIVCMPCNCVCAHICVSAYVCMCLHACIHVHVLLCMRVVRACVCLCTYDRKCAHVHVKSSRALSCCTIPWSIPLRQDCSPNLELGYSDPRFYNANTGVQVLTVSGLLPGCWRFRFAFSCLFSNQTTITVSGISASCAKIITTKYQCLTKALPLRPPVFELFSQTSSHWRTSCFSLLAACFILYCPWQCDHPSYILLFARSVFEALFLPFTCLTNSHANITKLIWSSLLPFLFSSLIFLFSFEIGLIRHLCLAWNSLCGQHWSWLKAILCLLLPCLLKKQLQQHWLYWN